MNLLMAVVLLPLHFTAPADTLGMDTAGRVRLSPNPVHGYVFHRLDDRGVMVPVTGYADSIGSDVLVPHPPGTRERVWLALGASGRNETIYVLSRDANGNLSAPSNGCVIGNRTGQASLAGNRPTSTTLDVPVIRQARERCGQAALAMVLRYYGAAPIALREVDTSYDPILRGSLITDLAEAARRAGYEAAVVRLTPDSLIELLNDGVPPILLYQNGSGPITVRHFGVVTGWNGTRSAFTLNEGGARPRVARRADLEKRWATAGSLALIVRLRVP